MADTNSETKSYEDEIAVEDRPLQSQVDELLAQVEMLRREEFLGNDEEYSAVYPEDPKEEEQPTGLNPQNYRDEVISRFSEADWQLKFELALMGKFDAERRRLTHLTTDGQEQDVAELMENSGDAAQKANFEKRLGELVSNGESIDFNEESGEVIVHIVVEGNYYTFALSAKREPEGESTLPPRSIDGFDDGGDGEVMPLVSSAEIKEGEEADNINIQKTPTLSEKIIDLTPVLELKLGDADLPESNQVIASPPILSAGRVIERGEAFGSEGPEAQRIEPPIEPTTGPQRRLESSPPLQPPELITEDDFEGISLIIERLLSGNSVEAATEIASTPAPEQKDGALLAEVDNSLPERVVGIHPSLEGEYRAVEPSLGSSELPEQKDYLDGIILTVETPLNDERINLREVVAEIMDMSTPEQKDEEAPSPPYQSEIEISQSEKPKSTAEVEMEQTSVKIIEIQEDGEDIVSQYLTKEVVSRGPVETPTVIQYATEVKDGGEFVNTFPEAEYSFADAIELDEPRSASKEFLMPRDLAGILLSPQDVKGINLDLKSGREVEPTEENIKPAVIEASEPTRVIWLSDQPVAKAQREIRDASPLESIKNIATLETPPPNSIPEIENRAPNNLDGISLAIKGLARDAEDNPGESATEILSVPAPEQRGVSSPASEPEKIEITAETQTEPRGEGDSIDATRLKEIPERNRAESKEVHYPSLKPAKTESGPTRSGEKDSPVSEQESPHFRFANFTPLESPAIYGRDGTDGNFHSLLRARLEAPSFLTGFAQRTAVPLKPLESGNNFIPFKPTAIVGDEEETRNDTINIYEPEFELTV